jgi:hypothetical protein
MAGLAVVITAAPAFADTSQATAQAASLKLGSNSLLTTGQVSASNDGTTQTKTGNSTPSISLLGSQTLLSAGVLAQDAAARNNGDSAACAGAVGTNGAIQVGPANTCLVSNGTGGVTLNVGTVSIKFDAIYASCTASSNGSTTGFATLVNPSVTGGPGPVDVPVNPTPNTTVSIPGILTLILNEQSHPVPGKIAVTALDLSLLDSVIQPGGAHLTIGSVTCGPSAVTPPVSVVPFKSLPLAGAALVGGGGIAWITRRRLSAHRSS